jgi:hypothetical protein
MKEEGVCSGGALRLLHYDGKKKKIYFTEGFQDMLSLPSGKGRLEAKQNIEKAGR